MPDCQRSDEYLQELPLPELRALKAIILSGESSAGADIGGYLAAAQQCGRLLTLTALPAKDAFLAAM
jgi:hypothetical protein